MAIVDHSKAPEVPWRPNYRKWDIVGAPQGCASTLTYNTAEPGAGAPLHTHNVDELIVVLEGELTVRFNGQIYTVPANHTLAIPPGAEHGFTVVKPAKLLVFFPTLDPYSAQHTNYLEGRRPASVKE